MKKNGMRKLLVLLMALVFAFSLSGCGETATLLSLYEDMNELGIYELNDNIRLDISMSEEALDTMDDEAKDILEKILPLLEDFSVKGVIDTEKMILDLEMVYQADGGEKPFADLMLNVPDREFFIDLTGALDWMRTWQKDFVAEMESDLDGKKWLRFELDEEWARMAESMTSDYLPLNGQGTYSAVLNTLASEYLAGLEDTVFDEFDSGLAKKINGGVEFRITYEQTAAYIEALGGYALEHVDEIGEYTVAFLENISDAELDVLGLSAEDRAEMVAEVKELIEGIKDDLPTFENYIYLAAKAVEYPDVAKLLGGSYVEYSIAKNGGAFEAKCDVLINLNMAGTSWEATSGDFYGNNSIRLRINETLRRLSSATWDFPAADDVVNAEDTLAFADYLDSQSWDEWNYDDDYYYDDYDDYDYDYGDYEDDGYDEVDWSTPDDSGRPNGAEYTATLGETLANQFFDWTVISYDVSKEFKGRTALAGEKFVVVDIEALNTSDDEIPLGNFDFTLEFKDADGKDLSLTAYEAEAGGEIEGMYPDEVYVAAGESLSGFLLFEAPEAVKEARVVYWEIWDDGFEGDVYYYQLDL